MLGGGYSSPTHLSNSTSGIEGYSLGEMRKIWVDLASSEMRLNMMEKLEQYKVGFNDVENFNLGLIYNSKTITCENYAEKDDRKVVEVAMRFKRKDEIRNRKKLIKEKIQIRKKMEKELGKTTTKKRRMMKYLNEQAEMKKNELKEKYENKIKHLRKKYEVDREKELDKVPEEMREFEGLSVFSNEKFEKIEKAKIEVVKFGEIELDEDEKAAMRLHPKMTLPKKLNEGYMNLAIDMGYTKVRWQMKKDEEKEKDENLDEESKKKVRMREEENEIEEARTRTVYDPERKIYDERKQRATDLKECSRIFLPKPLEVSKEAQLEMRREVHTRICEEYRKKECDEKGRQMMMISKQEMRGIRKLEKRKQDGEIVVITTDKSSKLCVMKRQDYEKLGEDHVAKDVEIERRELISREKTINQHAMSWIKMWKTGEDHSHEDRIRQSKTCRSENRADLYLSYKDHKKIPGKTRPIATGCSSNTLALSNSVSTLVESLANSEDRKHEVISTEDLLYNAKKHDIEMENLRLDWMGKILEKLKCKENHGGGCVDEEGPEGTSPHQYTPLEDGIKEIVDEIIENAMEEKNDPDNNNKKDENFKGGGCVDEIGSIMITRGANSHQYTPLEEVMRAIIEQVVEKAIEHAEDEKDLKVEFEFEREKSRARNIEMIREVDCEHCGPPVQDLEMCMLGLDVEALFPSMTSARTGEILRKRMMRSSMKVEGFD